MTEDSDLEETDEMKEFVKYCQKYDRKTIPEDLQVKSDNAMEDDCWKSTAVIDNDVMNEVEERVKWINFHEDIPYGNRLLKAAEKGCTDLVKQIVSQHGSDVTNHKDEDGYTPLHRACYQGYDDIVQILIDHGADVHSRTEDGWTPLHSAARWNKVQCATTLIAAGADVNALTNSKQTPLHIASTSQLCASITHLLLWHPDTDASIVNNGGETAGKLAASHTVLGPLFELKHKFVDINPLRGVVL